MPRQVESTPIGKNYGQQLSVNASNGQYKAFNLRKGYESILIEADGGTQGARVALSPAIQYVLHYDDSQTGTNQWVKLADRCCEDFDELLDSGKTNTRTITAMASADYLYIGSIGRVGGYYFDLSATINCNASVMTFEYSTPIGFTATAITDGTKCCSKTLKIDGDFTITTVPAEGTWIKSPLSKVAGTSTLPAEKEIRDTELYWARLDTNATLGNVVIDQLTSLDYDVAKGVTSGGGQFVKEDGEYSFVIGNEVGGFSYISQDSGTPKLNVTWLKRSP